MTDLQTEKAFQRQDGVFLAKKLLAKKTTSGVRYYKKVGLGKFSHKSFWKGASSFLVQHMVLKARFLNNVASFL